MLSQGAGPFWASWNQCPMSLVTNIVYLVVHRALGAGGLEAPRVTDDPARHEPAVASAQDAEPRGIDEVEAPERLVEAGHDVGVVAPAPVAHHGARERLAVALTSPRIRVAHVIARS